MRAPLLAALGCLLWAAPAAAQVKSTTPIASQAYVDSGLATTASAILAESVRAKAAEAGLLPLGGGALTGPLSGTVATFSGALSGLTLSGSANAATVLGRTLQARAQDTVNVADVGVAAAFSATNAGKKIIVPPGTWTLASTARVPDGSVVEFFGRNAIIAYTGTGAALEIRSSKNVRIDNLNVDLTGADPAAEALHVYGAWYLDIFHPRVVMNGANQAGIVLETSQSAAQGYGTYMIEVVNPQFTGMGLYGLRTFQTSGDTSRAVTHLNVRGGWSKGISYGLYLNYVSTGRVDGWCADTGIDAINIQNSNDLVLMPGELGPGTGYGVNFGAGNAGITMLAPSHAGVGGSLGYMNTSTFTPVLLDQSRTRFYASRSNQNYWIELGVNLQYNSTSGYLNFQGGNNGGIYQGIGFTQNSPVATGAFQIGEPTRINDVVLGRNTTVPGDTAGYVQMPSISGPATAAPLSTATNHVPMVWDASNKQLLANFGGASTWTATLTTTATTGITAAGTTQATATALTTRLNVVRTGGAGTGVILSATLAGQQIVVNRTGAAFLVYPPTGGLIDDGSTNAAVTIPAKGSATFERYPGGVAFFTAAQATATQ